MCVGQVLPPHRELHQLTVSSVHQGQGHAAQLEDDQHQLGGGSDKKIQAYFYMQFNCVWYICQ